MCKDVGKRQIQKFIKINELELKRTNGSHYIYKTQRGETIVLTNKMATPVLQRLAKQHHLNLKLK